MAGTQKGTVLICEDKPQFRRIYHDLLANEGFAVLEAEDGEMGWQMAKANKPDLMLLDLVLPKLHGFEVLERIRDDADTKQIPVIIFSVLGDQKDIQKGFELGADDYALKGSHTPREVMTKIRALLARADIKKNIASYYIAVMGGKADAVRLPQEIGLTKLYECPYCGGNILLQLIPDMTRAEGHWFMSHFQCEQCQKGF